MHYHLWIGNCKPLALPGASGLGACESCALDTSAPHAWPPCLGSPPGDIVPSFTANRGLHEMCFANTPAPKVRQSF
uniref:Uncharacterized protein n=1 Tax=Anguilla anguilla TaxID=7936 RepID=A0A0E9QD84_ANGAN